MLAVVSSRRELSGCALEGTRRRGCAPWRGLCCGCIDSRLCCVLTVIGSTRGAYMRRYGARRAALAATRDEWVCQGLLLTGSRRSVLTRDGTARRDAPSRGGCYRHHLCTPFPDGQASLVARKIVARAPRKATAFVWLGIVAESHSSGHEQADRRFSSPPSALALQTTIKCGQQQVCLVDLLTLLCCACVCVLQEQRVERFAGFC